MIDTIKTTVQRIEEVKENIKKVGLQDKVHIYEVDAVEILCTLNEKYDVVVIDVTKSDYNKKRTAVRI